MKNKKDNQLNELELLKDYSLIPWGDNKEPTPYRKLFAKYYTTKGDTFCNATMSYAAAYQYEIPTDAEGNMDRKSQEYNVCKANGCRIRTSPGVKQMIDSELMAQFNDTTVDSRLTEIIVGGRDSDSLGAIKEYNEMKGRVTKKVDVTIGARPLQNLSDEELHKMAGSNVIDI